MEWQDEGLLLRIKPHGESNVIATFFSKGHGLISGYIRTNKRYHLQQGSLYHIRHKSRLSTHIGLLTVEPHEQFASVICATLASPIKLACLNSIRTLLIASLIDHDTHDNFYEKVLHHINQIALHKHLGHYVLFEKNVLSHCGFGLDLNRCAVTNSTENLSYVSPKTGRAVTKEIGAPYSDQLFILPSAMYKSDINEWEHFDIINGLKITGHFLTRMLVDHLHRQVPPEREYLLTLLQR